jgi:hypothetical protein
MRNFRKRICYLGVAGCPAYHACWWARYQFDDGGCHSQVVVLYDSDWCVFFRFHSTLLLSLSRTNVKCMLTIIVLSNRNSQADLQAMDRAHRTRQTKQVYPSPKAVSRKSRTTQLPLLTDRPHDLSQQSRTTFRPPFTSPSPQPALLRSSCVPRQLRAIHRFPDYLNTATLALNANAGPLL